VTKKEIHLSARVRVSSVEVRLTEQTVRVRFDVVEDGFALEAGGEQPLGVRQIDGPIWADFKLGAFAQVPQVGLETRLSFSAYVED